MSCRGVHFALSESEVVKLRSLKSEDKRLEYLQETIEETYFAEQPDFYAESDKAWDAIHRALTDGKLTWDGGTYPLKHTILAGELLYTHSDYIMSLKTPKQVHDVASALTRLTEADFRKLYFAIDPKSYGEPVTEEDFQYSWQWLQNVRQLYSRAAEQGRYVLFTADQ